MAWNINLVNFAFGAQAGSAYGYLPFWGMARGASRGFRAGGFAGATRGAFLGIPEAFRAYNTTVRKVIGDAYRFGLTNLDPASRDPSGGFRPVPFYAGVGISMVEPVTFGLSAYYAARNWQSGNPRRAAVLAVLAAASAVQIGLDIRGHRRFMAGAGRLFDAGIADRFGPAQSDQSETA